MDGGGVEFAVGGVYDGFVVVDVEREVVDFFSGRFIDVAFGHGVGAYCWDGGCVDAEGVGTFMNVV